MTGILNKSQIFARRQRRRLVEGRVIRTWQSLIPQESADETNWNSKHWNMNISIRINSINVSIVNCNVNIAIHINTMTIVTNLGVKGSDSGA